VSGTIRLKHLCVGRAEYGLNIPAEQYKEEGLRLIRTTDVTEAGDLTPPESGVYVSREDASSLALANGDVLLSRSGTLGRCLVYKSQRHGPCTFAGYLVRFRLRDGYDPRFIFYCSHSHFFRDQLALESIQSTIANFNAEKYANLPLPDWSSEASQRAISDFLDAETARIDALIEKKREIAALTAARYNAAIDALAQHEAPMTIRLKRVARIAYGLGQPPPLSDDGVPIIRATNIDRGRMKSDDLIRARLEDLPLERAPLLAEGEILVVRSGALTGDSAAITGEWIGSVPGYDLRVTPQAVEPRFLAHQLLGRFVQGQVDVIKSRAAQPHLNADELGDILIRHADLTTERSVADLLDSQRSSTQELQLALARQIDLLAEHRQALITAAVTGELDLSEAG